MHSSNTSKSWRWHTAYPNSKGLFKWEVLDLHKMASDSKEGIAGSSLLLLRSTRRKEERFTTKTHEQHISHRLGAAAYP